MINPLIDDMANSDLDLIVAGTVDGVLMVESEARELSEAKMLEAVMFGHRNFQPVLDMIIDLAEDCAKEPWDLPEDSGPGAAFDSQLESAVGEKLRAMMPWIAANKIVDQAKN